jgi:arylsulfatase A-like enzyme
MGEHGLTGKGVPYEEGLRVPLAIKVPEQLLGGEAPGVVDELTANVDLAPTLLELAGARPCVRPGSCRTLDGRSLVPLLEGRTGAWPSDRAIPVEGGEHDTICDYRGLRLPDEVLLQRVTENEGGCEPLGAPELYDLDADPFQLDNLVASDPEGSRARAAELERRLAELGECVGIRGSDQRPDGTRPCE